jgi:exodeoxyribonuclease VII large subunit
MPGLFDLPFEDEPSRVPSDARPADARPDVETRDRDRPAGEAPPAGSAPRPPAGAQTATPVPTPAPTPARPPDPAAATPPNARVVYSVSELTAAIRQHLESGFIDVWIEGEVSNYRLWSGLAYFTLKDAAAQLRVVMFRSAVRRLRFALEDGTHVLVRGRVSVYEPRGEYQLVCEHVEPKGLGALQLAFEQLKKKLAAEGLFDPARKRPLPVLPRKIGIVTSLDGAALRDIIRVITNRHANVHLVIRPARVQGEGAAEEIARALAAIGRVRGVDVVIVGRGGGSIEDLWAFNEERVARAIAAAPVPVISAVGHDVDWTIADLVSDLRAATPSNAAEVVVARSDEFCDRIDRAAERLRAALHRTLDARRGRVHALTSRRGLAIVPLRVAGRARHADELRAGLDRAMRGLLLDRRRRLEALRPRLDAVDPLKRLGSLRARLVAIDGRLHAAWTRRQARARTGLATLAARLQGLSPLAVLGRGYALCWAADGRTLIREATPDLTGQQVSVTLARGSLRCDVRDVLDADPAGPAGTLS